MPYTLLLADDSVTIQRVIELTFADEDVKVVTVGDGQAAIDRLDVDPPDIVLADVEMPKRDGYEVAAYVKSRPGLAHIPVVLLTGAFEPIDHVRAEAAGSSDVLAKPFEPQMVINRVKQLLGKRKADEAEAPAPQKPAPLQTLTRAPLKAPTAPMPPAGSSVAMNHEEGPQESHPGLMAAGQAASAEPVSLDDYFDQLDAAFSNLQSPDGTAKQQRVAVAEEDWLETEPKDEQPAMTRPAAATSIANAPPPAYSEWIEKEPAAPQPVVAAATSIQPAPPPIVVPPIVAAPSPAAAAPPAVIPPPPAPVVLQTVAAHAPAITDDVIEEVVSRVLQRLSDKVVRETVTEIVSATAERLVQDEISRIKAESE